MTPKTLATSSAKWIGPALVIGMLVTGSVNTLVTNDQNQTNSTGINGIAVPFSHPWVQTWFMFWGEFCCMLAFIFIRYRDNKANPKSYLIVNADTTTDSVAVKAPAPQPRIFQLICALPCLCDIAGTTLGNLAFLYISASIWQMLRGAIIIFTGILSVVFLKRKLNSYHWFGMAITLLGLILVGLSSVLNSSSEHADASKQVIGICMVLGAQLFAATQMVAEETFLKGRDLAPLQVVGNEGSFGLAIMSFIILPIVFFIPGDQPCNPLERTQGCYENTLDAFVQIKNSPALTGFVIVYVFSIACYNFFGLSVTQRMTAVHRTLIDASRTLIVWLINLFVYYQINHRYGESWQKYSPLELAGFLILILGALTYNAIVKYPFLHYPTGPSAADGNVAVQEQLNSDEPDEKTRLLSNSA